MTDFLSQPAFYRLYFEQEVSLSDLPEDLDATGFARLRAFFRAAGAE